ncbi:M28 family peptidase [Archangium violaceum]|uniref:M28 family peptidase n=1 Tax=Archangium violaceum TaxID=83451 RepID=UPI00194FBE63|nr:M28 family peptidase [Archangium violaceum]QRN93718.1 M28 family peptidase [Archangium violaceum]
MSPDDPAQSPRTSPLARWGALALLVAALLLGFLPFQPPSPLPADAPGTEFSAWRARKRLEVIAAAPRPMGSPRHAEVREYLVSELRAMGLETEVQVAQVFVPEYGHAFGAATVHNVVARLPGRTGAHAVLVVGHYDSVPTGSGASDNGAAVSSMLETARALRQGPPLENDVLFLFSDGEEHRLNGAAAFQRFHPRARQVSAVLNFDARGTSGSVLMFQTGADNGWLIRQLAAAPHPVANSLSAEVYKQMPNSTDLTVFMDAGLPGLNFANIEGGLHYHTRLEDLEHLDMSTLQHQGELLLSMARRLGDADLAHVRERDAIYFNLGTVLVHYPVTWAMPLLVLALVLGAGAWGWAIRRGQLRARGLGWSVLGLLSALVLSCVTVWLAWSAVEWLVPGVRALPEGQTYRDGPFMLGFALLALGCHSGVLALLRRKTTPAELAAAGTLLWLIPTVLTTWMVPGASYLFFWPLLGLTVALAVAAGPSRDGGLAPGGVLALGLSAAPGLVLVAPFVFSVMVALTLALAFVAMVLAALLLAALAPVLRVVLGRMQPLTTAASFALGLLLVGTGAVLGARFDATQPRPNSAIYLLDADTHSAQWVSSDALQDDWLARFLGANPEARRLEAYANWSRNVWTAPAAQVLDLPPPTVEVVKDETHGGVRELTLRVASPRGAPMVELRLEPQTKLRDVRLAGTGLNAEQLEEARMALGGPRIQYWAAPPEGFMLTLVVESGQPLRLRVSDHTFSLPDLENLDESRPAGTTPVSYGEALAEGTRVTRTLQFREE